MYLADDSTASGDASWYRRQIGGLQTEDGLPRDRYVRLDYLDDQHAQITPFCFVVKVRCRSEEDLEGWLDRCECARGARCRRYILTLMMTICLQQGRAS